MQLFGGVARETPAGAITVTDQGRRLRVKGAMTIRLLS